MQRSSSKLIAKAGSIKNIAKAGYRFSFELQMESCDQMLGSTDVVCTWERGPKIVSTPPMKIDKKQRMVNFNGAVMTQEVTMFKKKKSDAAFEPKVYRLTLRSGSEKGKVIGKIDLNFSDYIEIPSFSKRIAAPLSSGGRLILRVNSQYLGEAEKGKKPKKGKGKDDDDTSSVVSGDSGMDGGSGYSPQEAEEMEERNKDMEDLDDLAIDDGPRNKSRPYANGTSAAPNSSSQTRNPADTGGYRYGADYGADSSSGRNGSADQPRGGYGTESSAHRYGSDDRPSNRRGVADTAGSRNRDYGGYGGNGTGNAVGAGAAVASSGAQSPQSSRDQGDLNGAMMLKKPSTSNAMGAVAGAGSRPGAGGYSARPTYQESSNGFGRDYGTARNGRAMPAGATIESANAPTVTTLASPSYSRNGSGHDEVAPNRQEMERLRSENKVLRRENDRLKERLSQLESGGGFSNNSESVEELAHENRILRRDIEELEGRLSREPVYADVVRELRESKMALAILTLERDELQQKVRSAGPSSGIASRNML